jgi:hypothetical protein
VKQLRPLVPRTWKKALLEVFVGPFGWNVAIDPLRSRSISNCRMTAGVSGCRVIPIRKQLAHFLSVSRLAGQRRGAGGRSVGARRRKRTGQQTR